MKKGRTRQKDDRIELRREIWKLSKSCVGYEVDEEKEVKGVNSGMRKSGGRRNISQFGGGLEERGIWKTIVESKR